MKYKLMNSAMMPREGLYRCRRITPEDFGRLVAEAAASGGIESYIGYEATADIVELLSGYRPEVSRANTNVEPGDIMLVARLKYRAENPKAKHMLRPEIGDFEFFVVQYEGF